LAIENFPYTEESGNIRRILPFPSNCAIQYNTIQYNTVYVPLIHETVTRQYDVEHVIKHTNI